MGDGRPPRHHVAARRAPGVSIRGCTHSEPRMNRRLLSLSPFVALILAACGQQRSDAMNPQLFRSPQAAALYAAASRGDLERARALIAEGVSLNSANQREQTLLDVAMLEGDRRAFSSLLSLGADPTYLGQHRDTPMHFAAAFEDPYWLRTIVARGASVETRNRLGQTPLFRALGAGTQANVGLLLEARANVRARASNGETLLHHAAAIRSAEDVWRFLQLGVDPNAIDDLGYTFQYAFFGTPDSKLSAQGRETREKVRAWLQARGIPIQQAHRR